MATKGVDRRTDFANACAIALGLEVGGEADFSSYASDPVGFVEKELRDFLTDKQKQICLEVRDNRETNVQACHGAGKSFLASRLILWWIYAVSGLVITTAPTDRQVEQIIWGEVRKIHGKLGLPGELGMKFLRVNEQARGFGFTASHTNSNAFQGIHNDKLLVIEDEACGISEEIDNGAESCTTGAKNRMLRIGNPIQGGGSFQRACVRSHIRISAWSHPNVAWAYEKCPDGIHRLKPEVAKAILDEDGEVLPPEAWADWCIREVVPGAVSISWIENIRKKKSESSAYWQSRVEGLFPVDSEASIVPRSWFLAARARYDARPEYYDELASYHHYRHGLDVGDGGDDHATSTWRGVVLYAAKTLATKGDRLDVSRAAGAGKSLIQAHGGLVMVDIIGVGAGALSAMLEDEQPAEGRHWGEAAVESALFANRKAEDYWMLREAFRSEEIAIAPLGEIEEMLMEDLAGTYYEETSTGKTKIEDKKKTIQRLHRSPNVGDATVYGFVAQPKSIEFESVGRDRTSTTIGDY